MVSLGWFVAVGCVSEAPPATPPPAPADRAAASPEAPRADRTKAKGKSKGKADKAGGAKSGLCEDQRERTLLRCEVGPGEGPADAVDLFRDCDEPCDVAVCSTTAAPTDWEQVHLRTSTGLHFHVDRSGAQQVVANRKDGRLSVVGYDGEWVGLLEDGGSVRLEASDGTSSFGKPVRYDCVNRPSTAGVAGLPDLPPREARP